MHESLVNLIRPENLLLYIFAYALASIPTSLLVSRIFHKVKKSAWLKQSYSSATIWRNWSKKTAVLVFVLDFLKGFIPCAMAFALESEPATVAAVALVSVIGHCFSIWLGFSGGRGASAAMGAMVFIYWPVSLVGFGVFLCSAWLNASAEKSSFFATFSALIIFSLYSQNNLGFWLVLAMGILVLSRHRMFLLKAHK